MNSLSSVRGSVRGFTLIELLVAVAIMAILATIAAPEFSSAIANQRVRSAAYDFAQTLQNARSEAILSRRSVDLRASYPTSGNNWNGTKTGTLFATNVTTADVATITGSSFYIFETGSGSSSTTTQSTDANVANSGAVDNSVSRVSTVGSNVIINGTPTPSATPVVIRFFPDSTVRSSTSTTAVPTNVTTDLIFSVTSPGTTTSYRVTLTRFGLTKVLRNS